MTEVDKTDGLRQIDEQLTEYEAGIENIEKIIEKEEESMQYIQVC